MRKIFTLSLMFVLFNIPFVMGQQTNIITGKVIDSGTLDVLIGATIWLDTEQTGTTTDIEGEFRIKVPIADSYKMIVSYVGFVSDTLIINASHITNIEITLSEGFELQEVEISNKGQKSRDNYERNQMSLVELSMEQVNKLPALLSENDVLKAIQLLPGIQSAEGAATGYYVRGGSSDQNLILLNNATVYNPFHAAGFISIFNGDFIKDIDIYKGAIPSDQGGRLSSLLNVGTKTPSFTEVNGSAGIGLVTAKLTVEAPIVKDKLAILVSGRAFYSYSLVRALVSEELKADLPKYYFYDAYGQMNWKASKKDDVSLFYYNGSDLVYFQDKTNDENTIFNIPWSNTVMGGEWKHKFNDKMISKLSAYQTQYDFMFGADYGYGAQTLNTAIKEIGARFSISHAVKNHYFNYGISGSHMMIRPEVTKDVVNSNSVTTRIADVKEFYSPTHINAFVNDDWNITNRIGLNYGIRIGLFKEGDQYYTNIDPKIVTRFQLTDQSAIKASYSYASQFVHLLVNSTATTPLDLWVSSNDKIKPQTAHSVSLGWYQNFHKNQYEASVETYYKRLGNQIEYKEGVDVFSDISFDDKLIFGDGWASGMEFFLRKQEGKLTGFVGYTLAWAKRQFDELNNGDWYNYKFDRRHDLTLSLNYQISDRWSIASLFVIGTGHTITVPKDIYFTPRSQGNGGYTIDYGERNSYRLKSYHRLDLSVTYTGKPKRRVQSNFKFDIYNVYNRSNAFFVLLTSENLGRGAGRQASLKEYSLIPILPSISYQMEF